MEDDKKVAHAPSSSPEDSDFENGGHPAINEKRLLRKIDLRLLPAVGILYLLSFLDRSNGRFRPGPNSALYSEGVFVDAKVITVGNARIEGLLVDLSMTGEEYLTGLTLYFLG